MKETPTLYKRIAVNQGLVEIKYQREGRAVGSLVQVTARLVTKIGEMLREKSLVAHDRPLVSRAYTDIVPILSEAAGAEHAGSNRNEIRIEVIGQGADVAG
jgi:hypothetical protein